MRYQDLKYNFLFTRLPLSEGDDYEEYALNYESLGEGRIFRDGKQVHAVRRFKASLEIIVVYVDDSFDQIGTDEDLRLKLREYTEVALV